MSKTVNGVRYVVDLVPESKWGIKCPYPMNAKKVTLHNTDNDMPASNEASYHNRNNNQTSFHLVADEIEVRQLLRFDRNGWHSGDGGNGYGNRNTIAMEFARNYDRKRRTTNLLEPLKGYYSRAEENGIKVLAQVMIDEGIVANDNNIKTHNDWNGKWCPRKILNEVRLQSVKRRLIQEYNRLKGLPSPSTPAPKPSPGKVDGHLSKSQVIDKTIAGGYGSQPHRENNIRTKTNFTYNEIQNGVNKKLSGGSSVNKTLSFNEVVNNTIDGKYGNGDKRKTKIKSLGHDPAKVQTEVNKRLLGRVPSKPKPKPRGRKLHLPASAKTWRIYNVNGPYTAKHAIHQLTPSRFGGITYDILEDKGNHVYVINTGVKGRVAIYAAPSTGARIT